MIANLNYLLCRIDIFPEKLLTIKNLCDTTMPHTRKMECNFELTALIHTGRNSKLYRAYHHKLQRNVVVKLPSDSFPSTKQYNKYVKEFKVGKELFNEDQ